MVWDTTVWDTMRMPMFVASEEKLEFARLVGLVVGAGEVVDATAVMESQYPYEELWNRSDVASHIVIVTSMGDPDLFRSRNGDLSNRVFNRVLPAWLSLIARDRGIKVVMLSSAWAVGNGRTASCSATPRPTTDFGRSLRISERVVMQMNNQNTVLRLPWMFGHEFPSCTPVQVLDSGEVRVKGAGIAYRRAALETTQRGLIAHTFDVAQAIASFGLEPGVHNMYPYKDTASYTWNEWVTKFMPDHMKNAYTWNGSKHYSIFDPCPSSPQVEVDATRGVERFVRKEFPYG